MQAARRPMPVVTSFAAAALAALLAWPAAALPIPAAAPSGGADDGLATVELAQSAPARSSTTPKSETDPRTPGEPPAAAQPPQEGHSLLPVKPSDRTSSETGQPAQSVPPGHSAKR